MGELLVKRLAHGFSAGPFLFADTDETPIERGVVKATEKCILDLEPEL